jgi:uncharacterized protein YigA (DUF484 family)
MKAAAPDDVAAYLRAHPGFLASHPELYAVLTPPARVHGEAVADHMAAMLAAARESAAQVLAAGRATASMAARVQEAVLALFGAADVAEFVASGFPCLLGVDAAALCPEADLPEGTVARILGGRQVLIRPGAADSATLHGEAARLAGHEALIRVPSAPPMLLALVARDPAALDPAQGAAPLVFLARAVAAALAR